MSMYPDNQAGNRPIGLEYESSVESQVIARFFNAVYAWMAAGLALTAVVAWYVSTQPQLLKTVLGPMIWLFIIAEFVLVIAISAAVKKINATVATVLFLLYAGLNGLTLSVIFLVYAKATLASAFFVTAGTFGATSVYGMVTKRDLSRLGSILFMALIGLVLASLVNIFLKSPAMQWIITYAGVLIFVGLTAWDTQKLKIIAVQTQTDAAMAARMSISGALMLYLDFINLFLFILRIMGNRK